MNKKELHNQYPDNWDIQNRFTAYVNSAFEKTRIKFYYRKKAYEDNLIMINEDDLECIADSKDILETFESLDLDMVENMSLWKALQKLSGKDITIIKLHILYDNTFKEIGKVLGMNEGAVKMRYTRAIKLLRDIVEE